MTIVLDCAMMTSRAAAHEYLKEQLAFPDHYGKNLDALYDLLTSSGELEMTVLRTELLEENLGGYGSALLATIREAAEENPKLRLTIQ